MTAKSPRTTSRSNPARKRHAIEQLEARQLLAALIGADYQNIWKPTDLSAVPAGIESSVRAIEYQLFSLSTETVRSMLSNVPSSIDEDPSNDTILRIPRPDGGFERFSIFVSSIMAPELAAKFPSIQTYAGQGLDNPSATLRFDVTPKGFHAQVLSPSGSYYIDPFANVPSDFVAVYSGSAARSNKGLQEFSPPIDLGNESKAATDPRHGGTGSLQSRSGETLRTYRLAVGATGEYTIFHGGTVALGMAAIVTAVNRVSGIYQTELSIAFQLVANNDSVVYTNPATDGYTNNNGFTMLGENQAKLDAIIGNANYDIGHVFSTGGGGVASLGSVGINNRKAQGVSGQPAPINDAFSVDYVAHEIGHQFGGNHTFNGLVGNCSGGNRNALTAYEPGSGTTIQAYAGICGTDDLQPNSDPYFHSVSLDEMVAHVDTVIPNVGNRTPTGNSIPLISAGVDYVIPARTPFVLTAVGSDANPSDQLTYDWQQRDLGPARAVSAPDNGLGPLFRVWSPTANPSRTFPRLSNLVNNTIAIGERLPTTNRQLNFRVIARDNRAAGGAFDDDEMRLTVVNTGAAFAIVSPNTNVSWETTTLQNVSWNVAGTTANGINALTVDISISTDGGLTYSTVAQGVPNNGSAVVRVLNSPSTSARVRVQGSNNVFFDISDANFTIVPASKTIDIQLGPGVSFDENGSPLLVAPAASITDIGVSSYLGATIAVSFSRNFELGDSISLLTQGVGPQQVSIVGNRIGFDGAEIGTFTGSGSSLLLTMNAAATRAGIERVLTRIAFVHTSDDPTPNARELAVFLENGSDSASNTARVLVTVRPINDAPGSVDVSLPSINEDTRNPVGAVIGAFAGPGLRDVDRGSSLSGVVLTSNGAGPAQGEWQFAVGSTAWQPVGNVSTTAGLVLAALDRLRFVPANDYFGRPTALTYRAIDNTYPGGFTGVNRSVLNVSAVTGLGAIALQDRNIVTTIVAVNDAPRASVTSEATSVDQNQPFDFRIPDQWFSDVDDIVLQLSIRLINSPDLPGWLTLDPVSKRLTGTPRNGDVGTYDFAIIATDSGGLSATVRLLVNVINVNDAPTSLLLANSKIRENRSGVLIGSLFATDVDLGDVTFFSVFDPRFTVANDSLFLADGVSLDYETGSTIALTLRVTDNGFPPLFLEISQIIQVIDENEFTPSLNATQFTIGESIPAGSTVGQLLAPDRDVDNRVRYRIIGAVPELFLLNESTGQISLKPGAVVDYETSTSFQFFVEAQDDGLPPLATTASVTILVTDVNEASPVILTDSLSISELQGTISPFGRVIASDADTGQKIRFSLPSNETRFRINATTGELVLTRSGIFDFETSRIDTLVVNAQDDGSPSRATQTTIVLEVLDANDPPTSARLSQNQVLSNVSELVVGEILVTDQDLSDRYRFTTLDDRFAIVGSNLVLAPGRSLRNTDPELISVPILVTEVRVDGRSYPLQLSLARINNRSPWQNRLNPLDADRGGSVDPLDVLVLVNTINNESARILPIPRPASTLVLPDYDIDGDGTLNPLDILAIINFLNNGRGRGGEGEGEQVAPKVAGLKQSVGQNLGEVQDQAWLAAFTQWETEQALQKRRRG